MIFLMWWLIKQNRLIFFHYIIKRVFRFLHTKHNKKTTEQFYVTEKQHKPHNINVLYSRLRDKMKRRSTLGVGWGWHNLFTIDYRLLQLSLRIPHRQYGWLLMLQMAFVVAFVLSNNNCHKKLTRNKITQ